MPDHEVVIIGAGFGGIGAAIKLREGGIDDFVILEAADDIGGTWRDNAYPGLAVDIASAAYQFSFHQNPDWSRMFAPGDEVKAYVDDVFEQHGLRPYLRLNTRVDELVFDEENHEWEVRIGERTIRARFVVHALGIFGEPRMPEIPGIEDFGGKLIHTARWDHDHDLAGERVAVIGTGATAVQLIPEIARVTGKLHVFQRTPIWVFPKTDPKIPRVLRWAFGRIPGAQRLAYLVSAGLFEFGFSAVAVYNRQLPFVTKGVEAFGRRFINSQVKDPELRAKLTPDYGFGCKRPTMSNTYFRTFAKGRAELVTEPIERITSTGIVTADGTEREIDTLICATGFFTTEGMPAIPITGRGGVGLRQWWDENRMQAYEGTAVPGFPNVFSIFGPYAFTGGSWLFMVEHQAKHITSVIRETRARSATLAEIRPEPNQRYFEDMLRRHRSTVFFNNRCATANSYYFDERGDAPVLRPTTALELWWRGRRFDPGDYRYDALATSSETNPPNLRKRDLQAR